MLDVTEPGDHSTFLAADADLRTDLPLYRVWRDGALVGEVSDARQLWAEHDDLVSFLIGCSFTFEHDLLEAGIDVRHISEGCNVPMYRTNRGLPPGRPPARRHGGIDAPE